MNLFKWAGFLRQHNYEANIPKIYLYSAIANLNIWMPVWVIFLQVRRGFTLTQVTLTESVFWVAWALSEVPTGIVADKVSRKASMVIGLVLQACGAFLYALAPSFALILLANIIWGVSLSFFSGATQSFLYDSLRMTGAKEDYTRIAGRQMAIVTGASAIGAIFGGLVASVDLILPLLITGFLNILALFLALTLKEPPMEQSEEASETLSYGNILQQAIRDIGKRPLLRYAIIYASILPLASLIISVTLLQPHAMALGVPVTLLGVLAMGVRFSAMGGSGLSNWFTQWLGESGTLILAPIVTIVGLLALGASGSLFALIAFAAISFANALASPIVTNKILSLSSGHIRSTILSVQSLLLTFTLAAIEPILGYLGEGYGLPLVFFILAIGLALVLLVILTLWLSPKNKVDSEYTAVSEAAGD